MNATKTAQLVAMSLACFAGGAAYPDYKWFCAAAGVACLLRAFVFTRRY
jgi:hypothetical protein